VEHLIDVCFFFCVIEKHNISKPNMKQTSNGENIINKKTRNKKWHKKTKHKTMYNLQKKIVISSFNRIHKHNKKIIQNKNETEIKIEYI